MTTLKHPQPLARKKLVEDKYSPDTFRVISVEAEKRQPVFHERIIYENTFIDPPHEKLPPQHQRKSDPIIPISTIQRHFRFNNPQPLKCGFLRENVASLNEPICSAPAEGDGQPWWKYDLPEEAPKPPYSFDSTSRSDYQKNTIQAVGSRHLSNPHKDGARGIVPVNFLVAKHGYPRVWKENLSYEHSYDCRTGDNYKRRGRRHGAFVWDIVPHEKAMAYIEHAKTLQKQSVDNDSTHLPAIANPNDNLHKRSASVWDNFGVNRPKPPPIRRQSTSTTLKSSPKDVEEVKNLPCYCIDDK